MTEASLITLRIVYAGSLLGLLAFLMLWESGESRVPFADARTRHVHALRNIGLFFWVVFFADFVVGQWTIPSQHYLLKPATWGLTLNNWPVALQFVLGLLASDLELIRKLC